MICEDPSQEKCAPFLVMGSQSSVTRTAIMDNTTLEENARTLPMMTCSSKIEYIRFLLAVVGFTCIFLKGFLRSYPTESV